MFTLVEVLKIRTSMANGFFKPIRSSVGFELRCVCNRRTIQEADLLCGMTQKTLLRVVCVCVCVCNCRIIHEADLPITVQCTCVRLLLNLVEVLKKRAPSASPGDLENFRGLLNRVLSTLSWKLRTLARNTPDIIAQGAQSDYVII